MGPSSINNPIFKNGEVEILQKIDSKYLIETYKKKFSFDVSYLFENTDSVYLCQCLNTKYQFFYPFSIAGDAKFYEYFQQFPWYYMPWKWEHDIAMDLLKDSHDILEIGSGGGYFLDKLKELGKNGTGLEINTVAVSDSQKRGLNVLNLLIKDFYPEKLYDTVCSFQVMEHIYDVGETMEHSLRVLKKGGKLIISVPNNSSYLKIADEPLNYPPHHVGRWTQEMVENISNIFPVELKGVFREPLREYHVSTFFNSITQTNRKKFGFLFKFVNYFLRKGFEEDIMKIKNSITGNTLVVVFEKC